MAHITTAEVNAWLEATKLNLSSVDATLEGHSSEIVIDRLAAVFNVSTWVNESTTPKLVRTLISMYYASYIYDRAYADDATDTSNYAFILRRQADAIIIGLLAGTIIMPEDPVAATAHIDPAYFPNDLSSANSPSSDFPSDGPPSFTMGQVF